MPPEANPPAIPAAERANLWVVCISQFLVLAGMTAVLPLLPLYLKEIGITAAEPLRWWTGALGAAPFLVAVFATPVWGAVADRFGHKPMVIRSLVGIGAASIGMGLSNSPATLLAFRGLQGAVSGVFPAAVGLLTSSTPQGRAGRALALLQAARSLGALSGPLLGGLAADFIGIRPLFFFVGVFGFSMALLSARVLHEGAHPKRAADAEPPAGWRELVRPRRVWTMLVLLPLFQLVVVTPWPTLALYVEELGVTTAALATTTGVVVFAAGLPSSLTATTWARWGQRFGLERVMITSMLLSGVTNAAVGLLSTRLDVLLGLRVLSGVAMAGFVPLAFDWLNREAPADARGRIASLGSTTMMIASVIGPMLASWLSIHVSLASTFWLPGVLLVAVGGVWAARCAIRVRER
jgi:DHA1 family multidrug resistance protein-like MFS transporter